MWSSLGIKDYAFYRVTDNNDIEAYVTDFVRIWSRTLKKEELVTTAKEMNPLVEATDTQLTEKVVSLLDNMKAINKSIEREENELLFMLNTTLSGIKFHFKLRLIQGSPEMFFEKVLSPFIFLAAKLHKRENKLIELITKKDLEIKEYKRENICIKRSILITPEFTMNMLKEEDQEPGLLLNNKNLIHDLVGCELFHIPKKWEPMLNESSQIFQKSKALAPPKVISDGTSTEVKSKKLKRNDSVCKESTNPIELKINGDGRKKLRSYASLKL